LDLTCPANFPEARSGREGTLQCYRDYFHIADHHPGVMLAALRQRPELVAANLMPTERPVLTSKRNE